MMEENSEAGSQRCQPGERNHLQKFVEIWAKKTFFFAISIWILKEKGL